MGHKIRQVLADRDVNYKLAGLIGMDDACFGALKPGKRGRSVVGKAKAVACRGPPSWQEPKFAAMWLMSRVNSEKIQPLVQERLATGTTIKISGWQGDSFLDASPGLCNKWLVLGPGKKTPKVLPGVHTWIANIKGNIWDIRHGVSPKHLPLYLVRILLPPQPLLLGVSDI